MLRSRAGASAERAEDVRFLAVPDRRKNWIVGYRLGAESLVLKVFRDTPAYRRQALANPVLTRIVRAYALRLPGPERADAEAAAMSAFRAAGFGTFELVERCAHDALVFRLERGRTLDEVLRDAPVAERVEAVRRVARDVRDRQVVALRSGERRLVHPFPRLGHVFVTDDGRHLHFDFEGVVNPSLGIEALLGLETESFLAFLAGDRATANPECIDAAVEALGDEVMSRLRRLPARPFWFLSGSARHRRRRLRKFGLA